MKFIYSPLIIFVLLHFNANSQVNTSIVNQKTIGGSNWDLLRNGLKTSDNGYLIGGSSSSGISGEKTDTNRGSFSSSDFWILNLDHNLNIQWQKTIGGNSNDDLAEIIKCSDGGYLCVGSSISPVSADKTVGCYGQNDYWVVKLDSSGNILWQNVYGGLGDDNAVSAIQLGNGSFIIAGSSDSDSSGVKSENSRGWDDYWVVCIDSIGNLIWDKTIGGSEPDGHPQISQDLDNNIYIVGQTISPVSGDKTAPSYGQSDIWLIKIGPAGNIIWDKSYGGSNDEGMNFESILIYNNYIYLCTYSASNVSGNKTDSCRGYADYWILKLDLDGNKIWDKTYGGAMPDAPETMIISQDKELIIGGISNSDISGDKLDPSFGMGDQWIICLDTNGFLQWQKTIGGNQDDDLSNMVEIGNNNYILFGSSQSGISGLKTETCRGNVDYWVVEIATNVGIENNLHAEKNVILYPNPATNSLTIESSLKAIIEIINIQGQIVKIYPTNDTKNSVDISALQGGIYFLKLTTAEGSLVKKFVKE